MADHTRMKMLGAVKASFMFAGILIALIICCAYQTANAATLSADNVTSVSIMWQVITGLLALLQTIFICIGLWLINNQTEIFKRVGKLEASDQTREALCEERHK